MHHRRQTSILKVVCVFRMMNVNTLAEERGRVDAGDALRFIGDLKMLLAKIRSV